MIYIDTSALTKLLIAERETPELQAWLATQSDQGEYAATMWVFVPHLLHVSRTSLLSKCFPPSDMNVSQGAKAWKVLLKLSVVVFALPAVLYLYPNTCCENVSK